MVKPSYKRLVKRFPQVIFLDADMVRNTKAINAMNIQWVPTFIAFKNHQEQGRYVGTDKEKLEDLVRSNL